jgi:HK97 gp10 family phage protein
VGSFKLDTVGLAAISKSREVDAAMHSIADEILAESQIQVPVDTGALKRSGFVDGSESEYRIGYGDPAGPVDYAKYVEFGTRHMNPQPYLTPAALKRRGVRR